MNGNTMMSGTIDTNTNNGPVFSSVAQAMMVCQYHHFLVFILALIFIYNDRKKWDIAKDKV